MPKNKPAHPKHKMALSKPKTAPSKHSRATAKRSKAPAKHSAAPHDLPIRVRAAVAGLRREHAALPELVLLDAAERRSLPKARAGAEPHVRAMDDVLAEQPAIATLARAKPGDLAARWDRAEALAPLRRELASLLQATDDGILLATSEAWKLALDIRELVHNAARRDPSLADKTRAFDAFMSTGPRDEPAAASPAPTPPA